MTKKKSKALPTPDKYLEFLQQISLQGIGLENANVNVDRAALAEAAASKKAGEIAVDADFKVVSNRPDALVVAAGFILKQMLEGDSEKVLLLIECSFSALFGVGVPIDDESAGRFANNEAKLIFWPYLRHFVSDTSYRMAITPVLLPLVTSAASPEAGKE